MELKQVILVRMDLKLPPGKLAAQCAHASVQAVFNSDKANVAAWKSQGQKKIVLKVKDEKELLEFVNLAKAAGLKTALITDAGKTVIAPGTKTCLGIGPDDEEKIDSVTSKLKMV
ncbi:peptidyl-tRNA hydrolase [Candidatus Woesearchaeota archaeon]|nr:peptidyl-tRNA hydrolase [Candidatus Woesearchaeota archaeon]